MSDGLTDRRSEPDKEIKSLISHPIDDILNWVRSGKLKKASTDDIIKTIKYLKDEVKQRLESL